MPETIALQKTVPVAGAYDLVVCGGGVAGVSAAISAARAGMKTALIPKNIQNLLAAGRCICADQAAFAFLRVQATLMAIGEAAGIMAGLCREQGTPVQEMDAVQLQKRLGQAQ